MVEHQEWFQGEENLQIDKELLVIEQIEFQHEENLQIDKELLVIGQIEFQHEELRQLTVMLDEVLHRLIEEMYKVEL
jgi:hypothetical protein